MTFAPYVDWPLCCIDMVGKAFGSLNGMLNDHVRNGMSAAGTMQLPKTSHDLNSELFAKVMIVRNFSPGWFPFFRIV